MRERFERMVFAAGFTLVEVITALGLLTTASVGLAHLVATATARHLDARFHSMTMVVAAAKMEQLRGLAWGIDRATGLWITDTATDLSTDPPSPGGRGLAASPGGTLHANVAGYVDYLDANGAWIGTGTAPVAGTCFIRRWAIHELPSPPSTTLVFEVMVTTLRREQSAAGRRTQGRLPDDAWIVGVKTRMVS